MRGTSRPDHLSPPRLHGAASRAESSTGHASSEVTSSVADLPYPIGFCGPPARGAEGALGSGLPGGTTGPLAPVFFPEPFAKRP
jgi:hypothetical protein